MPAVGLFIVTLMNLSKPPTTVLTALSWAGFLGLIGFQGFRVPSRNAFSDFHFPGAKYFPPAFVALSIASYLAGDSTACALGAILAFFFGMFVPYWQAVGRSKPFRMLELLFFVAQIAVFFLLIYFAVTGGDAV